MAQKIIIDLQAKTDKATKEIKALKDQIQKMNKDSVKQTEKFNDELAKVQKNAKGASKGFLSFKNILKGALGLTLVNKAFQLFGEILQGNQKVVDIFSTATETLSIIFNKFAGGIIDAVSSFDNFKAAIGRVTENLKTLLMPPIIRVQKLIKGLQLGFKALFQPKDSEGILRLTNEMKELDEKFVEAKEDQIELVEAGKEFVTETIKQAKANVDLKKSAELAAVANQGLLEKFDLQAEQLRQVRDEERLSIEERRKANDDLAKVLDEQEKVMLENAQISLAAAQAELAKDVNNIESKKAVMEAENELAAVRATVAGFRSEQLANDLALDKEEKEMVNSKLESESKLSIERKRFNAEQIEDNLQRLQKQKEIDLQEQEQEQIRLQAIIDDAAAGTQAKVDAQVALDQFIEESRQKNLTRDKEITAEKKAIDDTELANKKLVEKAKLDAVSNTFGAIAGILGESSKAGKAFATGQALINTYQGVTEVLASKSVLPEPIATIARIANIATVLATGLKTVRQINSTQPMQASGGGVSSGGGAAVATPQAPAFNIVGAAGSNQLAQTLAEQTQKPVKAYVVAGDVTTAQSMDRNIIQESALG